MNSQTYRLYIRPLTLDTQRNDVYDEVITYLLRQGYVIVGTDIHNGDIFYHLVATDDPTKK